ncbi:MULTISPECIES: helix-turn-helix transcriptional regulator [unclassified Leptolyngbya]|uniref:helix-turn-helix transcriptional regulator n=1 Tax=unclassified Leptolyngbya TaxID=2650499 RepID=UPI0016845668|nr:MULTISPECIES: helix-turn-helix transcriptional regulator [unclassified Leptolyngbya]MBD1910909.1 helix-turn-helix transcriptional regulator [Leptolyngbya sp. FACHB-8]MBD2154954.1 helix-turn-helix transcriptional regulator [Leptolyngbya sp. FACHB-16]
MTISQIAALREQAGLTQRELALAVGVTETTIANWERGRSGLDWIERLIRLCRTLNCNLEDLIAEEVEAEPSEPTFEELRQMYREGRLSALSSSPVTPDAL